MDTREKSDNIFKVATYESDLFGKMSLFSLFNHFQELAGTHAEYLQVGYNLLQNLGLAWILSRIKVEIVSLPAWGETVQLTTWPKGINRLFAMRDFCLKTEKGETLVLATTAWLLLDIENNRPKRIETLPIDLRCPGALNAIEEIPDKIPMPDQIIPVFDKQVWLSEIDINLHVNNAQYAKWIIDCFSKDQFTAGQISSMQINFLEETLPGDNIELFKSPGTEIADEYFICGKSRTKGTNTFHALVKWAY